MATWKARLFRITFSTISELQRWISVAAFAHDAVVRSISTGGEGVPHAQTPSGEDGKGGVCREEGARAVGVCSSSTSRSRDLKPTSMASLYASISLQISSCKCRSFGESWGDTVGRGEGSRNRKVRESGAAHEGLNVVRLNLVALLELMKDAAVGLDLLH